MKLKVKISFTCLEAICNLFDAVSETHAANPQDFHFKKEYKAQIDIVNKVFEKLKVTLVKKSKDSKPFNISLEYFQAFYLLLFIRNNLSFIYGQYEQAIIYLLTEDINSKL